MLTIYADENMPLVQEYFSQIGKVNLFAGRSVTQSQLEQADILLVRSVTKVNAALLDNTPVKFVGTATIGTEHLDEDYLTQNQIRFASAAGCNAQSVAEYVIAVLLELQARNKLNLEHACVGIVGAGNTGSGVAGLLNLLGIPHKLYDPYLARVDSTRSYASWQQILDCDVISLHTPLTKAGEFPTHHLINTNNIGAFANKTIINACRGGVLCNQAVVKGFQNFGITFVLDVWEGEPNIDMSTVRCAELATPHIAGYSFQGKSRGTYMLYLALCHFLQREAVIDYQAPFLDLGIPKVSDKWQWWRQVWLQSYDIRADDRLFRQSAPRLPESFDEQRKVYPQRIELGFDKLNQLASQAPT